ncbi:MAG TPA: response regulator [Nitrospiraceae bacterium]|nr:response regulator [Nitrospiraceae bacterium]
MTDPTGPITGIPIRVLIVDNHSIFRQVLRNILGRYPDVEIVGEAANGLQAVERADTLRPELILMDVNMPLMGGIEATRTIKDRYPRMVIIGLSADAKEHRTTMHAAGAFLVLTKEDVVHELYVALHRAKAESARIAAPADEPPQRDGQEEKPPGQASPEKPAPS